MAASGNPAYQDLDPQAPPGPVTPADGPSDAAGWAMVTPRGTGTAPYDIAAPLDEAGIAAACDAAGAVTGAGIVYPQGPRQAAAETLLSSPAGFSAGAGLSGYDMTDGFTGDWPEDVQPRGLLETPVQGAGDYPGTTQDGVPSYGC